MDRWKKLILPFSLFLFSESASLFSQPFNSFLNRESSLLYDRYLANLDSSCEFTNEQGQHVHTSIKYPAPSPVKPRIVEISTIEKDSSRSWLVRKLLKENLFIIRDPKDQFYLTIDPYVHFEFGRDLSDSTSENIYRNGRGLMIRGNAGKKFAFASSFQENQARFAQYIDDQIAASNYLFPNLANYNYSVIPGMGRAKIFKKDGYDFAFASGYISFSPNEHFNLQAGTGKHFIGDGYRSLMLSDNSFNYPYFRLTTSFKRIEYVNIYSVFMNLTHGGVKTPPGIERLFQKKAAAFQFLSWKINRRLQWGFFQGLIWEATDSMNRMHLKLPFANPVIFTNALGYGLGHENNIMLGSTFKLKLTSSIQLYGQFILDETGNGHEKWGWQGGAKYFDVAGLKGLHLQAEWNQASPFTYSAADPAQSWSHFNQPLAHPLGADFKEMIGIINYSYKNFFSEVKVNFISSGSHPSNVYNAGSNIFLSDTANLNSIGLIHYSSIIVHLNGHIGYMINPRSGLNIVAGCSFRNAKPEKMDPLITRYFYLGLRSSLENFYFDF